MAAGATLIYYDVTDLVRHAQHSSKVTGIQRVVLEGMRGLGDAVVPVFVSQWTGKWYTLPEFDAATIQDLVPFAELWERADLVAFPEQQHIDAYMERVLPHRSARTRRMHQWLRRVPFSRPKLNERAARFIAPDAFAERRWPRIQQMPPLAAGDKFVLFGTPWNAQAYYDRLFQTMDPRVERIFLVYDLIPLNSPFVPDDLREAFRSFIPFVLRSATSLIVNSESARRDLDAYAVANGFRSIPINKINLAHHLPPAPPFRGDVSLRVRKLFSEKFIMCVGSIESRKNHLNLLTTWSRYVRSPDYIGEKLVIAGVWAWDFDAIQNLLHQTGHVYGSVIVIERPSDEELRQLYAHCRFTVYPSHHEGFGLPVGESLSFGKPCLYFDNSSLGEAGLGMSDIVPYQDLRWYYQALKRLLNDDGYYRQRCDNIARRAHLLRSWADFSREVADMLRDTEERAPSLI